MLELRLQKLKQNKSFQNTKKRNFKKTTIIKLEKLRGNLQEMAELISGKWHYLAGSPLQLAASGIPANGVPE